MGGQFQKGNSSSGVTKSDIFGRVSLDSLSDFSNLIDFSNTEGVSKYPSAAIGGNRLYVVWDEATGERHQVLLNSISLVGVATGPTPKVDQEIHGNSGNAR